MTMVRPRNGNMEVITKVNITQVIQGEYVKRLITVAKVLLKREEKRPNTVPCETPTLMN